jgi:NADH dehydrogenase FAD-containing subunit
MTQQKLYLDQESGLFAKEAERKGNKLNVTKTHMVKQMPSIFIVGECILLRMYQISKYRQPSFATVLQRALLYTYIMTYR